MLWVAAFLALIIWVLGMASGFLGLRIHLFLLFAILAALTSLLPTRVAETTAIEEAEPLPDSPPNAKSVPGTEPAEHDQETTRTLAE